MVAVLTIAAILAIRLVAGAIPVTPIAPATAGAQTTVPAAAAFAPIHLSGHGADVVQFTIPTSSAAIASFTHNGSANFIVEALAADGSMNDGLVNVIGAYQGTVLFDANLSEHTVALDITADGAWTATISPPSAARAWTATSALTGRGDDVIRVTSPTSGLKIVAFTHSGTSNFIVASYSNSGYDGLINEIGPYSGRVNLPDGTYLLSINADGQWTATP